MTTRAEAGERQRQAMEKIAQLEREQRDWDLTSLAGELGISPQQCRMLVATLTMRGDLVHGERVVRKQGLITAPASSTPNQAA